MSKTVDMSKGNATKLLFLFTLPMLLSATFQQLYNIADSVIAGQLLGKDALAAVSASFPITMIFVSIGMGLSTGCSVVCGKVYGEKDYNRLKSVVSTSFISFLLIGIFFTVLGFVITEPILRLLSTPESIIKDSVDYLQYYVLGIVFTLLYNVCNATFRALGNSKIPLFFLIFSTVFNVILDIIFLNVFHMGVYSLSLATVIAQGIAAVLSVAVLMSMLSKLEKTEKTENVRKGLRGIAHTLSMTISSFWTYCFGKKIYHRFVGADLKEIMRIGVPSVIQHSTISIGQLFIQNLVNSYGEDVVAGYGAAQKINLFTISLIMTFGSALSVFVSQNIGARTPERIKEGIKATLWMNAVMTAALILVIMLFAPQLVSLFVDGVGAEKVISTGQEMLYIITPFYALLVFKGTVDNVMCGAGYMKGFIPGTFVDLGVRVVGAYVLAAVSGSSMGIWWSWPMGWVFGCLIAGLFFFLGLWKQLFTNKDRETISWQAEQE